MMIQVPVWYGFKFLGSGVRNNMLEGQPKAA